MSVDDAWDMLNILRFDDFPIAAELLPRYGYRDIVVLRLQFVISIVRFYLSLFFFFLMPARASVADKNILIIGVYVRVFFR